nr:MAG TPA: hypothetical protein [Caudoviricetes sp.]
MGTFFFMSMNGHSSVPPFFSDFFPTSFRLPTFEKTQETWHD